MIVPAKQSKITFVIKIIAMIFLLAMAIFSSSCSDEAVKPSRDATLSGKATEAAAAIFRDYDSREFESMRKNLAPEAQAVKIDESFKSARHEFRPRRVTIEKDALRLVIGWEAKWTLDKGEVLSGGQCVMVFSMASGKVTAIEGDDPFVAPK